jgi:hypothetical protein
METHVTDPYDVPSIPGVPDVPVPAMLLPAFTSYMAKVYDDAPTADADVLTHFQMAFYSGAWLVARKVLSELAIRQHGIRQLVDAVMAEHNAKLLELGKAFEQSPMKPVAEPIKRPYCGSLFAVSEAGDSTLVDANVVALASSQEEATTMIIDSAWDERLTAASLRPAIAWKELKPADDVKEVDDDDDDHIALVWSVEDVLSVAPELTAEQAREVLYHVKRNHDADRGVNWDTLRFAAELLFPPATPDKDAQPTDG